jgi:hypothetical protein
MIAYLVSALAGDKVPGGVDVALLDGVEALKDPGARLWMAAQGFGSEDPAECMYLAPEAPPDGFPSRRLRLSAADTAAFEDAAADQAEADAERHSDGYASAVARLRRYREVTEGKGAMVREASAAGVTPARIAVLSGLSRQTVYRILEGS